MTRAARYAYVALLALAVVVFITPMPPGSPRASVGC